MEGHLFTSLLRCLGEVFILLSFGVNYRDVDSFSTRFARALFCFRDYMAHFFSTRVFFYFSSYITSSMVRFAQQHAMHGSTQPNTIDLYIAAWSKMDSLFVLAALLETCCWQKVLSTGCLCHATCGISRVQHSTCT